MNEAHLRTYLFYLIIFFLLLHSAFDDSFHNLWCSFSFVCFGFFFCFYFALSLSSSSSLHTDLCFMRVCGYINTPISIIFFSLLFFSLFLRCERMFASIERRRRKRERIRVSFIHLSRINLYFIRFLTKGATRQRERRKKNKQMSPRHYYSVRDFSPYLYSYASKREFGRMTFSLWVIFFVVAVWVLWFRFIESAG